MSRAKLAAKIGAGAANVSNSEGQAPIALMRCAAVCCGACQVAMLLQPLDPSRRSECGY